MLGSCGSRWARPPDPAVSAVFASTRLQAKYRQRLALQLRRSPAYMQWHVDAGAAPLKCLCP